MLIAMKFRECRYTMIFLRKIKDHPIIQIITANILQYEQMNIQTYFIMLYFITFIKLLRVFTRGWDIR